MSDSIRRKRRLRQSESIIIHFDYDCFYASVFEHENPTLKSLPLAVQQKQIVVTCNYEARRRGLYKLQPISEAKKICPDAVIVLGEDLTRFRDVSKELYAFLRSFSWNSRCERLGFDEVFLDVSDIIDYNVGILSSDLGHSFFCLSKNDPTVGFPFNATRLAGYAYPEITDQTLGVISLDPLHLRLLLASHLAQHIRGKLESEKGYTATAGVSTNKLLSKLVGGQKKPNGQTTLLPPYTFEGINEGQDNVTTFIDNHEIGKIPGIGFKMARKLRVQVLQRPAEHGTGQAYGGNKDCVRVCDVRKYPGIGPETLEKILGGPGTPHGIGARIWGLLNGCDETEVGQAREVPRQISIEDSYIRLDTVGEVVKELRILAKSLLKRMYIDLLEDDDDAQAPKDTTGDPATATKRWLAHPKTIRLSTRPRPPHNPDGSRNRSFARISKSVPMPTFIFGLKDNVDAVVERLVSETLVPLFRRLHPEKSDWDLNLINIAAINMADAASEKGGVGRDISKMFKRQDHVLKQWRVEEDTDTAKVEESIDEWLQETSAPGRPKSRMGSEDILTSSQGEEVVLVDRWESGDEDMLDADAYRCEECGAMMPLFAMGAHARWHA